MFNDNYPYEFQQTVNKALDKAGDKMVAHALHLKQHDFQRLDMTGGLKVSDDGETLIVTATYEFKFN